MSKHAQGMCSGTHLTRLVRAFAHVSHCTNDRPGSGCEPWYSNQRANKFLQLHTQSAIMADACRHNRSSSRSMIKRELQCELSISMRARVKVEL